MNTTIRNLDEATYRAIKARAALAGKSVGEMVNEAIRAFLARPEGLAKTQSIGDLRPESYAEGDEGLSGEIDVIVYGVG